MRSAAQKSRPRRQHTPLPRVLENWFAGRGWRPRQHQLDLLCAVREGRSCLLIAPTGAGKTLAGFMPTLAALTDQTRHSSGIHTLYISPLKALAVDVARNLTIPASEMALDIRIETRTGDTPVSRRQRQKNKPPEILLTTPEQISLLLSHPDAADMFGTIRHVVLDELHALTASKRGDLLALALARLRSLSPELTSVGLSATVAQPAQLRAYLERQQPAAGATRLADVIVAPPGVAPEIEILESAGRVPWSGHTTLYALPDIYAAIKAHKLSIVFVNTRSQAELLFQNLWHGNTDNLPIALHHGSLDVGQRRKVEAAMADGRLRAVVATSTLDLGIDWGDVDLVIHVGAPKGASRLAQRIGRANHRLDEPSKALLVPSNRFEVLECRAALEAARDGAQDTPVVRTGGLDVLAQHVMGTACASPFDPDVLFEEVRSASPYSALTRVQFDRIVDFVSTGGYALRSYERYARLRPAPGGRLRLAHPRLAQTYRMNAGTIVEAPMLKVRLTRKSKSATRSDGRPGALSGGRVLGEIEEWFIEQLSPGDTFVFAGQTLRFAGIRETDAFVTRAFDEDPRIPSYQGGKFPLSTHLAARVRAMLADPKSWDALPRPVAEWLTLQQTASRLPERSGLLVETFPRSTKHYLVCYPFEGRLAHQTLGMLLTRRLERARARPLGFVCNDYALAIWTLGDLSAMIAQDRLDVDALFDQDMLGDDLDAWLASSSLMKRTFRNVAIISGLIERRHPGKEKTGRQMTVSSDLIYDVLRQHDPGHILLEATWADAAEGLLDIGRLGAFLDRIRGRITHRPLGRVSPLAVPVLLEIGIERVAGEAGESLLRQAAQELMDEATGRLTQLTTVGT